MIVELPRFKDGFEAIFHAVNYCKNNSQQFIPEVGRMALILTDEEKIFCKVTGLNVIFICNDEIVNYEDTWCDAYMLALNKTKEIQAFLNKYELYNLDELKYNIKHNSYKMQFFKDILE